ncbi:MAG: hypothetical protein GX024_03915 [Clostridiales bacterium]|nr:hypothetical protein [Clostridiales bacterium]
MAKRVLSILLVLSLFVFVLAGCSTSKTTTDEGTDSTTDTQTDTPTDTDDEETEGFAFTGYPMDAKDVKLTWWVGHGFTLHESYASYEESPFHSGLSEHVGVDIEWQFPTAGTDGAQAFNLMLASDTLPDIFYWNVMRDAERYIDEGVIRDLTEYMPKYSPAYYKFIQSNEIYDKSMKTDSGKYYGYGFFREDGGWNDTYQGPVVRQDWLDELGLESPETISDWDNVLRAFNEKYGAVLTFPWYRFKSTGISGAFGAYGAIDFQLYIDDNGKVQLAQAQEEWKNYMAKLNEWWKTGLLDQDVMTTDDDIARTKALNGVVGLSYTSMGQLTNWISDANSAGTGAKWVGLQYPKGDDGTLSMVFGGYGIGEGISVITTSCPDEKLEIAMRVLDYAYTDEGHLYWNFGTKGVTWDYDENGEVAYTELVTEDPDGLNNAIAKYSGSVWSGSCIQATKLLYLKNSEESIKANDLWFYPNEEVTAKWKLTNGITLTVEESNELDDLVSAISTYVSEKAVNYITGEESFDGFNDYVAQLDKMGLQRVLEIYQGAYDRFMAR